MFLDFLRGELLVTNLKAAAFWCCGPRFSVYLRPCKMQSSRKVKRGLWSPDEDDKLKDFISKNGIKCWSLVPTEAGLQRCGKSCRLRWLNYLRPGLKRGNFTIQEKQLIMELQTLFGNKWSWIAKRLPGRTDNEIKNFWNAYKARNTSRHVAPHDSSFRMAVPAQIDDNVTMCASMVEETIRSDSSSNGTSSFEGFVPLFCEESSNEIEPPSTLYMESWMDDLPLWQDDDSDNFDWNQLMQPFE